MAAFEDQSIYPGAELFLIKQFLRQQGIEPRQWLLGSGLKEAAIEQPDTLVSLRQFDIVYRNIDRLSNRADVGLALGRSLNLSRWGLLALALQCSRTLGSALETANRFRTLVRSRFTLTPSLVGEYLEIRVQLREGMSYPLSARFAQEMLIGSLKTQIGELLATPFEFHAINLDYPAPDHAASYRRHFQCPVQFGCAQTCLLVPLDLLQRPLPLANPVTERQVLALCNQEIQRVAQVQQGDLSWLVRAEIARAGAALPNLEQLAARLRQSPRSLRRKLQEAGTSFREICQQHQLQLALQLLAEQQRPISAVAEGCGFHDSASFREAFRRWTGMTPQAYRRGL